MNKIKKKPVKEVDDHGKSQAKAQLENIMEIVGVLLKAREAETNDSISRDSEIKIEEAEQRIQEHALSVEFRSGWINTASKVNSTVGEFKAEEYKILLCTGGPAVQIIGGLSEYQEPETARIQYQDWGTPWTDYRLTSEEEEAVKEYARQFYFGA